MDTNEVRQTLEEADCLFTHDQVQVALDRMSVEITEKLGDANPLILSVMTGGIIPAGQLLTRLDFPLQLDYIHATRYRGETSGGKLNWIVKPAFEIKGRSVLIIDDIYDEGITLSEIVEYCSVEGATEVYTAVLVEKNHARKEQLKPDFIGVQTEDRYLFGYGMDYRGYLRNASGIFAVKGM